MYFVAVYLRTSPEVVFDRMKKRGRPEEANVSLEYLTQLHKSHEKWLMSNNERYNSVPVLVLDANLPIDELKVQYEMQKDKILGKIVLYYANKFYIAICYRENKG